MRIYLNQNGLTLAELFVSTTIIGIIMMGMVSVDFALRSTEQQQSRSSITNLRTAAVLEDIVQTASQAYGDAASRCIQIGNITTNSTNYICVYRDYGTPVDFTDDNWQCYTRIGTDIHKCTRTLADDKGSCLAGDPIIGTVTADTFDAPDTPTVVSASPDFYFAVTIKNRFDPTRPVPGSGSTDLNGAKYSVAIAKEYMTNPKVKLSARVAPNSCAP